MRSELSGDQVKSDKSVTGVQNPALKPPPPSISVLTLMTVPYSNDQCGVKIHIF